MRLGSAGEPLRWKISQPGKCGPETVQFWRVPSAVRRKCALAGADEGDGPGSCVRAFLRGPRIDERTVLQLDGRRKRILWAGVPAAGGREGASGLLGFKAMSRELSKAYDPQAIEEKWAKYWVSEGLFATAAPEGDDAGAGRFAQLLPPPNVTGRLHMGHMLNQTEMDILARWHRMLGERVVWVPGTDHAGIATQMMVERQLAAEGTTTRRELGREAFTERVWAWKRQYGGAITEQMRRLGVSVDWSREYFTMDERLSVAVREGFVRLWEQGLIYRGAYIVNWDPQLQSAVSDLEVDSEERAGKLYHVRYALADGDGWSVVIATTRPETMLGDVGGGGESCGRAVQGAGGQAAGAAAEWGERGERSGRFR